MDKVFMRIIRKGENEGKHFFVGETLGGRKLRILNFDLGDGVPVGSLMEMDLDGLEYEETGKLNLIVNND